MINMSFNVNNYYHTQVVSATRYVHAGSILGMHVDPNPLEELFHNELHRSLPNDGLHLIELGIFKHVLTAIHAKFAAAIHEMASVDVVTVNQACGWSRSRWCWATKYRRWQYQAWTNRVWERMRERLLECGLSDHVAKAFLRHEEAVQTGSRQKHWGGMAGHEVASLVKMLPFTLRDLLFAEREIVREWAEMCGAGQGAAVEDPSEAVGDLLARLLTWVSLISRPELTESMVHSSDLQAKDLMILLPQVFPFRRWNGHEGRGRWNFPKLHQMFHVADEIRRYSPPCRVA